MNQIQTYKQNYRSQLNLTIDRDGQWILVKLRLGALIPRSVCLSVCRSVLQKLKKIYKTVQNISTKRYKILKEGVFVAPPFQKGRLSRKLR